MYLVKIKVWNKKEKQGGSKIFAVKTKSTLNIIKEENFKLFLDENEVLCKDADSVDIRDEKQIFKDSNCGIFRVDK